MLTPFHCPRTGLTRLFSHAGPLFTAKRSFIECKSFKSQLLLRLNRHITERFFKTGSNIYPFKHTPHHEHTGRQVHTHSSDINKWTNINKAQKCKVRGG